jgi:hypothetical protein
MGPSRSKVVIRSRRIRIPARIPEIQAIGLSTRKRQGEVAEAAFLAKASSLGFGVAKPWGDSERYDFILDAGHHFWRVQVKSTERFAESRYRVKAAGWKANYTRDEIDFIVIYLVPVDLWYVVPVDACVGHGLLNLYPHGQHNGRLEKYREAWCLMACHRDAPDPNPITVSRCCQSSRDVLRSSTCPLRR